ncbi:MAG: threonine/serine dehydratase [Bdellovibrionales bacterium]|nr:threonine/serine dehydratase [Bdellovibrionales bacterium]
MDFPTASNFRAQHERLRSRVVRTPVQEWVSPRKDSLLSADTEVYWKLELFQKSGSFKYRGAISVIDQMNPEERQAGVVAGTGGNHGIAVALAAKDAGVDAKIIVPKAMNSFRRNAIDRIGAEIVVVDCISQILDEMHRVAKQESRTVMHPFEHPAITLGAGTLGVEFLEQVSDLDVVIVPIGGGGLASGVSCAIKEINPKCEVYGVEPVGANSMQLSIEQGSAVALQIPPKSIADSLCSPKAESYSFAVCQKYLDGVVLIEEGEIVEAMRILFEEGKVAVEPAGAAATAALLGPLRKRCLGRRVGVIVCGSNIDVETFFGLFPFSCEK